MHPTYTNQQGVGGTARRVCAKAQTLHIVAPPRNKVQSGHNSKAWQPDPNTTCTSGWKLHKQMH
jgi:hypothetical protein